ncbi:hypothetical protein BJ741DRAFT_608837 [Chytriomyces cf. hyalinus JEL632]|nr:hypothetical protein BJ741DRAFT_608837 [Chytriomyces cf. hyalinus JEL632]
MAPALERRKGGGGGKGGGSGGGGKGGGTGGSTGGTSGGSTGGSSGGSSGGGSSGGSRGVGSGGSFGGSSGGLAGSSRGIGSGLPIGYSGGYSGWSPRGIIIIGGPNYGHTWGWSSTPSSNIRSTGGGCYEVPVVNATDIAPTKSNTATATLAALSSSDSQAPATATLPAIPINTQSIGVTGLSEGVFTGTIYTDASDNSTFTVICNKDYSQSSSSSYQSSSPNGALIVIGVILGVGVIALLTYWCAKNTDSGKRDATANDPPSIPQPIIEPLPVYAPGAAHLQDNSARYGGGYGQTDDSRLGVYGAAARSPSRNSQLDTSERHGSDRMSVYDSVYGAHTVSSSTPLHENDSRYSNNGSYTKNTHAENK